MVDGGERALITFFRSFSFAFRGLAEAWRREPNFRFQCVYSALVVALLIWLKPPESSALLVLFVMSALLGAELMNSAVERAVDLAVDGFHPLAKSAKDLAASSVLVVAIGSALVNVWVFGSMIALGSKVAFGGLLLGFCGYRFGRGVSS